MIEFNNKTKFCIICENELPATAEYFHKNEKGVCGLDNRCRKCRRQHNINQKLEVITHYGGRCAVCGEATTAFLTMDHINNDGLKHIGSERRHLYYYLINNYFPPGFQVLCWNHNWLKQIEFIRQDLSYSNHAIRQRRHNLKLKTEVIICYGGKCQCCKEINLDLLSVDHIEGNGLKHRVKIGGSQYFYSNLKIENFPSGYQVLCLNCNCGKHINGGVCPHKSLVLQESNYV